MKKILGLVAILAIAAVPAFGADPSMTFHLQLDGNNNLAAYEGGTPVGYTPGTEGNGTVVAQDAILNWAVRVEVAGDYNAVPILGAANIVFDLVLEKNGVPVATFGAGSPTTQGYFSTINNADDTGTADDKPYTAGDPPVVTPWPLLAAFTYTFTNVVGTTTAVPGRIFDEPASNGPHLKRHTYPTAMGYCLPAPPAGRCSTATGGSLVGMGAGYEQFLTENNPSNPPETLLERAGVGLLKGSDVGGQGFCSGLGSGPVAEGQLNLKGLTEGGIYVLKLTAGNGNNVVRGDMPCDYGTNGNFAVKVDPANVTGDAIEFTLNAAPPPCEVKPVIASAVSRRTHGAAGDFDIPLSLTGNATVEGRQNGPQKIIVTYDKAIAAADGTLDTEVALSAGTLGGAAISGNTLTIDLSGVADNTCLDIAISGITCEGGGSAAPTAHVLVTARFADVNNSRTVNSTDVALVRGKTSPNLVTAATFIYDLNCSSTVNSTDVALVRGKTSPTVSSCAYP